MNKIKKFLISDKIVYFLVAIFVFSFFLLSLGRHLSLKSYLNDVGVYDQLIWNTLQGRFLHQTAGMTGESIYLAGHFSPILLFFVPFYGIFSSSKWLLFFQAFSVGISALPVYFFAKEKLKSALVGQLFVVCYLLYPFLQNGVLYDFHEVVFAVSFASFAFYFLEKRKDGLFILFAILLSLSQEHLPLVVFMMGIYAIFIQKRKKFGILVSVFSLSYFLSVILIFMPLFSPQGNIVLMSNNSIYPSRYAWLGSSFSEILKNILTHPLSILFNIFSLVKIKFIFSLLMPVFSLGLYSWIFLIVSPVLAINLLSENNMTYSVYFYHNAVVAPFVFFSAIIVLKRWFQDNIFYRKIFLFFILIVSIYFFVINGLTPASLNYNFSDYVPDDHDKKINELKKIIPPNASLSVQHNLGPHFSQRQYLYRFPLKVNEAEFILLDETDPYRSGSGQVFNFAYALQMNLFEWENKIRELKSSSQYDLVYNNDGYLLFKLK